jgi:hypothetical protein
MGGEAMSLYQNETYRRGMLVTLLMEKANKTGDSKGIIATLEAEYKITIEMRDRCISGEETELVTFDEFFKLLPEKPNEQSVTGA